jgi:phosphatidylglycerophosphatase A
MGIVRRCNRLGSGQLADPGRQPHLGHDHFIGIPAATAVARASASKDPQFIVIDEVAGQLVALIAVPLAWKTFLAGFILFRVFDIWKPFPIRRLERLPEGAGIVVDDLGAGLYAFAVMHLLLHFGVLIK